MASGLHEGPKVSLIDTESDSDNDFLSDRGKQVKNASRVNSTRQPIDVNVEVANSSQDEFNTKGDLGLSPSVEINQVRGTDV